jgi:hypothetical protein
MLPFDPRVIFVSIIRDPAQLEPTMERFTKMGEEQRKKH